jgi:hypothetical protein
VAEEAQQSGWDQDDTIDVMILVDRTAVNTPLTDEWPPAELVDRYVLELHRRLQTLENQATLVVEVEELPDEDDYPYNIHGVVTNVPSAAQWTRSWGGNLVTFECRDGSLILAGRETKTFDKDNLEAALEFTSQELDALPDDPPDAGITAVEHRRLEIVLGAAGNAVDELSLNPDDRALLQSAVDTLRAQLMSPEPDRHIIGRVLRRFATLGGGIAIGVFGNYATDLLRQFHVPWP